MDANHDPDETRDAPVPAGLNELTDAQSALAELYGLDKALIAAAARVSPPIPDRANSVPAYSAWVQNQPEATKNAWLCQLMEDPHAAVRREMLADYHKSQSASLWPTIPTKRTISELLAAGDEIQHENDRKEADAKVRARAKKLAGMAADPATTLREVDELAKRRGSKAYDQIAALLADLREALSGTQGSNLAEQHARDLRAKNPTLNRLVAELRRQGFLKK